MLKTSKLLPRLHGLLLSFRVSFRGLNYPLFDGAVSTKARLLLASGKSAAALQEYQRLAELGSGKARCIIAYAHLLGTPLTPRDFGHARKFALAALSSEPGFSNFILACIHVAEGQVNSCIKYCGMSAQSGFLPAVSMGAQIFSERYFSAERDLQLAESRLILAVKKGHVPAILFLARFYLRGTRGFRKRLLGALLIPIGIVAFYLICRFGIFSIHAFSYYASDRNLLKGIKVP
jgi:TPR repeat protein